MDLSQIREILNGHSVYLSEENEDAIIERSSFPPPEFDAGDLALRTCLCGEQIDGFDEYIIHLKEVFGV